MNWLHELFGHGTDLSVVQLSSRALVVFIIALIFLRFSGRRSFGMRSPFDNVISILLGAVLSRALVGASPFGATIAASFVIVTLHRVCGWLSLYSQLFGKIVKGESKMIYDNKHLDKEALKQFMISEKDLMEEIRVEGKVESLSEINKVYVERDGRISVIK